MIAPMGWLDQSRTAEDLRRPIGYVAAHLGSEQFGARCLRAHVETVVASARRIDFRLAVKRRTLANYLLTGLLQTPPGASWYGDGQKQYRQREPGTMV